MSKARHMVQRPYLDRNLCVHVTSCKYVHTDTHTKYTHNNSFLIPSGKRLFAFCERKK